MGTYTMWCMWPQLSITDKIQNGIKLTSPHKQQKKDLSCTSLRYQTGQPSKRNFVPSTYSKHDVFAIF